MRFTFGLTDPAIGWFWREYRPHGSMNNTTGGTTPAMIDIE